jgi:hypothetical protein
MTVANCEHGHPCRCYEEKLRREQRDALDKAIKSFFSKGERYMSSPALYVKGFKPPDEKWKEMKQVYDACRKAKIDPPKEVEKFFNYETPDNRGVEVEIKTTEWGEEMREGFEIKMEDIPKDVKVLRFYASY